MLHRIVAILTSNEDKNLRLKLIEDIWKEYEKQSEEAYLELTELYNWDKIECIKDGELRSIEDINEEINKNLK